MARTVLNLPNNDAEMLQLEILEDHFIQPEEEWGDEEPEIDWKAREVHSNYRMCRKCFQFWGREETRYSWGLVWEYMSCLPKIRKSKVHMEFECSECHGTQVHDYVKKKGGGYNLIETHRGVRTEGEGRWIYLPSKEEYCANTVDWENGDFEHAVLKISLRPIKGDNYCPDIWEYVLPHSMTNWAIHQEGDQRSLEG